MRQSSKRACSGIRENSETPCWPTEFSRIPLRLLSHTRGFTEMTMTRRDFVRHTAATATTLTTFAHLESLNASEQKALPIVDTHQHLWDLDKFKLGWLEGAPPILNRSYVEDDYRAAVEGLNVVRAVY